MVISVSGENTVYILRIYKETSIISETGTAICQKLTLGVLVTITLEVAPFDTFEPFPALLPFFKSILEVVICGGGGFSTAPPAILHSSPQLFQNGSL
jgi:hypothetical protein